jgi:hypothetical protein
MHSVYGAAAPAVRQSKLLIEGPSEKLSRNPFGIGEEIV